MNDDHKIKTEVLAELAWEPSITADHIGVGVNGGVVTLSGHVDSYWQKAAAERAVGQVKGVRAVAEEILVRLPGDVRLTDEDIAAAALHGLAWSAAIPDNSVKVHVQEGFVTLTGDLPLHYQSDEVARMIGSLAGVTGLANHISVKEHADTTKIEKDIDKALRRAWFSSEHVEVTADEGEVHLTGQVESCQDRNMATLIAWRASGTTSVVNDIRVT
jgi:osmotically-inducible protein OsmY